MTPSTCEYILATPLPVSALSHGGATRWTVHHDNSVSPLRAAPATALVLLRLYVGWCWFSYHARTKPPDSHLLCAEKMEASLMRCLKGILRVPISIKKWPRHLRPGAPLERPSLSSTEGLCNSLWNSNSTRRDKDVVAAEAQLQLTIHNCAAFLVKPLRRMHARHSDDGGRPGGQCLLRRLFDWDSEVVRTALQHRFRIPFLFGDSAPCVAMSSTASATTQALGTATADTTREKPRPPSPASAAPTGGSLTERIGILWSLALNPAAP